MMGLIRDDRIAHFKFLEREGLLYQNTDTWMPCPNSYGYVADLPPTGAKDRDVPLKDCWGWFDAQEKGRLRPEKSKSLDSKGNIDKILDLPIRTRAAVFVPEK